MDDFDLINVERNYMDKNLIDQNQQEMDFQNNDGNDGYNNFFKENQKMLLGEDEEFSTNFVARTQRSIGFNEYIEFQDPSIKGTPNSSNILSANRNKKLNILSQNDINKTSQMFQKYENDIKLEQNEEQFEVDNLTLKINLQDEYQKRISHHIGQEIEGKNADDEDDEEIRDQILPLQQTNQIGYRDQNNKRSFSYNQDFQKKYEQRQFQEVSQTKDIQEPDQFLEDIGRTRRGMSYVDIRRLKQKEKQKNKINRNQIDGSELNKGIKDIQIRALSELDSYFLQSKREKNAFQSIVNQNQLKNNIEQKDSEFSQEQQELMQKYKDLLDQNDKNNEDHVNQNEKQIILLDGKQIDQQMNFDNYMLLDFYKEMEVNQFEDEFEFSDGNYSQDEEQNKNEFKNESGTLNQNKFKSNIIENEYVLDSIDMIRFIDWNERRHRIDAQNILKANSLIKKNNQIQTQQISHRLSNEIQLNYINQQLNLQKQRDHRQPTSIAVSDELILVGNNLGELYMYDRSTQEDYEIYKEKGKEFEANAITALVVHPTKPEYILIGYQMGQIIIMDLTQPNKAIKIIKDNHKGQQIVNMVFLDQNKEKTENKQDKKQREQRNESLSINPFMMDQYLDSQDNDQLKKMMQNESQKQGDLTSWMFASVDFTGRVIVTTLSKSYFNFKVQKYILIEPKKQESKYLSLSSRFKSNIHPQKKINDFVTLMGVGNEEKVIIYAVNDQKAQIIKEIQSPKYYYNKSDIKQIQGCLPSMTWGFSHSPVFKDQMYATLAVSWGPLIQLYILNDVLQQDQIMIEDGFIIIQSEEQIQLSNLIQKQNNLIQSNPNVLNNKLIQIMEEQQQDYQLNQINPFLQQQRFRALSNKQLAGSQKTPFEMIDLFIEKIEFLSESIILVLTQTLELKILYTQKFNFGNYDCKSSLQFVLNAQQEYKNCKQYQKCLIDKNIFISSLKESDFGSTYQQTISLFNGMLIGLGTQGLIQFNHIRWDEGLFKQIQQNQWIFKFQTAVDMYFGNVKGFKDLSEDLYIRQETIKAELKLLIRNIITDQLEQWNKLKNKNQEQKEEPHKQIEDENPYEEDNPYEEKKQIKVQKQNVNLDESSADILENIKILEDIDDKISEEYRKLIRVSIEFCVILKDCYFLFYDLFLIFQEDKHEKEFLDELKNYIIAGKFYDHDLPNDILQNHIINYYKDPHNPEIIEKIIINLSLKECPKSVLMELIQFCEQNFLSTGIIYLHTAVYNQNEDALCVPALMQILGLYRKAKNINPGSISSINRIVNHSSDSIERINAEKSQLYLGYKILWMIRLFLNGKKFPQGNIPEKRWKNYVFELVDSITQSQIMRDLLYIDSEAYFQIVSIIFYKGKVFDFINQSQQIKNQMILAQQQLVQNPIISNDVYEEKMNYFLSHEQILDRFDKVCQSNESNNYYVPDEIRLQYLYFVANVPSKCGIKKSNQYYFQCIKELVDQSQNFLKYNKNLIDKKVKKKKKNGDNIQMDNKYLQLSENALVELMKLCEPMTNQQIDLLLTKTENTKFNFLRMQLLNNKQDYVQCLLLFVEGQKNRDQQDAYQIFQFMAEKLEEFNKKKLQDFNQREISEIEAEFKKQIFNSFKDLINISANLTFDFLDQNFPSDLQKFVDSLQNEPQDQFKFLDSMFTANHEKIQLMIEKNLMSALETIEEKTKADQYMILQKQHLILLCQIEPQRLLDRIRQIKRNEIKIGPQECFEICEKYNQIEACAILSNKMCQYLPSLQSYIKLLTENNHYNYPLLIQQITNIKQNNLLIPHFIPYLEKTEAKKNKIILKQSVINNQNNNIKELTSLNNQQQNLQNSEIIRFDYIIRKALKVCEKESQENQDLETVGKLWLFILDSMFQIKSKQISILNDIKLVKQNQQTKGGSQQNKYIEQYDNYIMFFEEFLKSRINFVIEKSLDSIELGKFLDHLAKYDENIKLNDLREMIQLIFTQVNDERMVLTNAYKSAMKQISSSLQNQVYINSFGLVYTLQQCYKCNKFIDEDIRDLKKRKELMRNVRRGTLISNQGFFEDDNDEFNQGFQPERPDNIRLYDCGHAFHNQCIYKLIQEKNQKSKTKNNEQMIKKKIFNNQKCPWCFSDKFKIDFENLFKKNQHGRQKMINTQSTKTSDSQSEMEDSELLFDDFDDLKQSQQSRKINPSKSFVKRQIKSIQEQKLQMFDANMVSEGVTVQNFKLKRY